MNRSCFLDSFDPQNITIDVAETEELALVKMPTETIEVDTVLFDMDG